LRNDGDCSGSLIPQPDAEMKKFELSIKGMPCGHCVKAVDSALIGLSGVEVESVEVGTARGEFNDGERSIEELVAAVEDEGFQAESTLRG